MRNFIMVLLMMMMCGCAGSYVEVGAGHNASFTGSEPWVGGDAIGTIVEIGQEWEHNENWKSKCRYIHVSQLLAGPPFNNKDESTLDHFGCAVRYQIVR